jgi:lysophospholipid acyltransferase (LPLAT)-like uncharacterized protein
MLKKLGRTRLARVATGFLAVGWLRLVRATTRFVREPADFERDAVARQPIILAMWHGQHFMLSYAWPKGMRVSALISRSGDGELNARVLERLGVEPIRGSGGAAHKIRKRGGSMALREMLRRLADGSSVALTADVPKISRVAGPGIVTLARLSGRPIYPIAVVCRRRIDFHTWDRASIGLPFGRGAMVLGDPIDVARDADPATLEAAREAVERGLDVAHARAYALVGCADPGAKLVLNAEPMA